MAVICLEERYWTSVGFPQRGGWYASGWGRDACGAGWEEGDLQGQEVKWNVC